MKEVEEVYTLFYCLVSSYIPYACHQIYLYVIVSKGFLASSGHTPSILILHLVYAISSTLLRQSPHSYIEQNLNTCTARDQGM